MSKRLVIGLVVAIAAAIIAIVVLRGQTHDIAPATPPDASPTLIDDFRAVERASLRRYNEALADQRANRIDELALASIIENEILPPWRAIRDRVNTAAVPATRAELYGTLKRYLEARQLAWEAYAAGLRAGDESAARPHYEMHHQKNAEADAAARELGQMFRAL